MMKKTDPTDDPLNLRRRGSSAMMFYFTPLQFVVSGSSDTLSPMSLFRSLPPSKKRFFPWGKITPASVLSCGALNTQRSNLTQNCDVDALFAAQNIHSGLASLCPAHWCKTAAAANATPVDIFGQNEVSTLPLWVKLDRHVVHSLGWHLSCCVETCHVFILLFSLWRLPIRQNSLPKRHKSLSQRRDAS